MEATSRGLFLACVHALPGLLAEVHVGAAAASLAGGPLAPPALALPLPRALLVGLLFQLDRLDQMVGPRLRARPRKGCSFEFRQWRESHGDRHCQSGN